MMKNTSEWNGYTVYGDARELDYIACSDGRVNLYKDDILYVLSSEGKNYVTSAVSANPGDAFNEALTALPCDFDTVTNLIIHFSFGNRRLFMSELSSMTDTLSKATPALEVIWGISPDETLGDSYKVTLLTSIKEI
ncbi:MAG: hypothetical protein HDR86_07890 [Bacteroides sp.]|nr:hypothetical protein [Bacteroides sp.]